MPASRNAESPNLFSNLVSLYFQLSNWLPVTFTVTRWVLNEGEKAIACIRWPSGSGTDVLGYHSSLWFLCKVDLLEYNSTFFKRLCAWLHV
jgi:hypothetical protein